LNKPASPRDFIRERAPDTEIDDELDGLPLHARGQVEMGTGRQSRFESFSDAFFEGELSYIWNVPEGVRSKCLPGFERWCERAFRSRRD
jgi:hypothetical protein